MAGMFGFASATDMLGRPWRGLYAPQEAARLSALTDAALAAEGVWRGEATGRRRDDTPVEIDMSLNRLPSGGLVCITRDVTAHKREARERARLRDQLQAAQRQEAAGQLAAGLAHDFNNILAAIAGSAALLRDDLPEGDPRQAQVGRIAGAAGAAAGLVARLMALAARRTARARIDLRGPVRDAVDLASAGLPAGVEIETDLPDAPLLADADPTEVMQVALNLAINARDALRGLGGRIRVALAPATAAQRAGPFALGSADPNAPCAALCVEDDGIGMDQNEAAQAFRPYFSTKGADGTGLGLSVLAGIVTAAGGAVRLDTAAGEGARFTVIWPLAAAAAAAAAEPCPAAGPARLDGLAVLVVDDAAPVLRTLAEVLERAGAEVGACEDPADALEAIAEDPDAWALLVTDYDMPGMTGAELARAARAAAPLLPVVLCTALPDRLSAERSEFDAVVGKPVTPEALLEAAGSALARRKGPRQSTEDACES
jgi:signal transduction histidine kinase